MTLEAGKKLGPYEIVAPLGAGGMGEVYRARDTRLNREVAVKVLPAHLAESPELRQRFEREAKAISQLTHPHICTLHDVGNDDGVEYLVMELVDGESLAERLTQGALPTDQVLRYGIEIADALEAAHKHGIVHRDLKPGNVMLTKAGVKLLDFGLAKHRAAAAQGEIEALTSLATEMSPSQPLTAQGTIMGTFQYMAPEQLEGEETDERGDIFALGCVLYEMATGKKAFSGKSRASLIGSILKEDPPPISSIEAMTPPALDRLVQTCLAKDPEDRFQTAHDVKLQLQWIAEGGSQVGAPAVVSARRKSREKLAWGIAALAILAAVALGVGFFLRAPKTPSPARFTLDLPENLVGVGAPRISPDGRYIAFSARAMDTDGVPRIWVRPRTALKPHVVPGTSGAQYRPFWSPDSRFLAFVANNKLEKVALNGSPPQTICSVKGGADGSWGKDGIILYDGSGNTLHKVPAMGGVPRPAVATEKESSAVWPYFLPDGRHFLFFETGGEGATGQIMVASLEANEKPRRIASADSYAIYTPPGFLIYVKDKTLLAQPFDASSLQTKGEPVPLAGGMGTSGHNVLEASAADDGTLVYRSAGSVKSRLVWADAAGKETAQIGDPEDYGATSLSPDGTKLALAITDPGSGNRDIWVRDLARNVSSRLTFDSADDYAPLWSPDGKEIAFTSTRGGSVGLYEKGSSGTGTAKEIWSPGTFVLASSWSRDGRFIATTARTGGGTFDIWIVPTDGKRKPFAFVSSPSLDGLPVFSPDGRYVAYMSNETGKFEVYVRSFPEGGGKWQVSGGGGHEPHWSADGKTIFYRTQDGKIMAAPVTIGKTFSIGAPRELFTAKLETTRGLRNRFLPVENGNKFLLVEPQGEQKAAPMTVVLHWPQTLGR